MENILVSFLYLVLYLAIIIFVAVVIRWVITSPQVLGMALDAGIEKWGRIIVVLLCVIAVVVWLFGALGGVQLHSPFVFR